MFTLAYTIYNKVNLIEELIERLSLYPDIPKMLFFDNCDDGTVELAIKNKHKLKTYKYFINSKSDVFETKANNFLLKHFKTPYCVLLQDDMLIGDLEFLNIVHEVNSEQSDVGLIGFRDGCEMHNVNDFHSFISSPWSSNSTKDFFLKPKEWKVKSFVNRGPLVISRKLINQLGYFDEDFYPLFHDDTEYCLRARNVGLRNVIAYSEIDCADEWGTTRNASKVPLDLFYRRNVKKISLKYNLLLKDSFNYSYRDEMNSKLWILKYKFKSYGWEKSIKLLESND